MALRLISVVQKGQLCVVGGAASAGFFMASVRRFIALTIKKTTKAIIMKLIRLVIKAPYIAL